MYLTLHQFFESKILFKNGLELILPKLVKRLQEDMCVFCDCGAGVGHTGRQYKDILASNLQDNLKHNAKVYCYEPLPENFQAMLKNLGDDHAYIPRNVAVSNKAGIARFVVPSRMKGNSSDWSAGTSYAGFLHNTLTSEDSIEVKTVRLEDETSSCFDFVKLDLQGGELNAIKWLGNKLSKVKLLYVETQLLTDDSGGTSADYLRSKGFLNFFDRLQFGLNASVQEIPFKQLSEIGLVVDRVRVPDGSGMPLILWGHFSKYNGILNHDTLSLKSEIKEAIKSLGVYYLQTDLLSFNQSIVSTTHDLMMDVDK